jgi:hypothetical protein
MKFVFVQLGSFIPRYLESNIKRLSVIFPGNEIYLITNNQRLLKLTIKNLIPVEYVTSTRHDYLLNKLSKKTDFREGFWRLSLERIIAFTKFQIENKFDYLLHIESDVIVFPNLPIDAIKNLNSLSWCQYNSRLDIATLLYSPNPQSALYLQKSIESKLELDNSHTDMTLLSEIRLDSNSNIALLPSLPEIGSLLVNEKSNISLDSKIQISSLCNVFGGIFDSAAIGVWLLGKNPENTHAMSVLHDRWIIDSGDSFIDPSRVNFVIKSDGSLSLIEKGIQIPIFNLHVHSKNFNLLSIEWEKELDKFVKLSEKKYLIKRIEPILFIKLFILNLKRKKIIEFISTLPWLYSLRMKIRDIYKK